MAPGWIKIKDKHPSHSKWSIAIAKIVLPLYTAQNASHNLATYLYAPILLKKESRIYKVLNK